MPQGLLCEAYRDRPSSSGALPACLLGTVPRAWGRHAPPPWLGFLPHPCALLAVSAGALAAGPIPSLLRVQRTETKQNKLVSWPEQRVHLERGPRSAAPCLSPLPRGLWLSAATSCRLLFYIWYFEKSMMIVNGVQRPGEGLPELGRTSTGPACPQGACLTWPVQTCPVPLQKGWAAPAVPRGSPGLRGLLPPVMTIACVSE